MATSAVARGEPVVPKEECSPFDIGLVISTISKASNAEKYHFINYPFHSQYFLKKSKNRFLVI